MDESPLAHAPLKVRFRLGALTFLRHQFHRKYLLMGLPLAPPIGEISYLLSGKRIATGTVMDFSKMQPYFTGNFSYMHP